MFIDLNHQFVELTSAEAAELRSLVEDVLEIGDFDSKSPLWVAWFKSWDMPRGKAALMAGTVFPAKALRSLQMWEHAQLRKFADQGLTAKEALSALGLPEKEEEEEA